MVESRKEPEDKDANLKPTKEKPWVDIIKGNHSNGIVIKYTVPMVVNGEIEVLIEEKDIASERQYWGNTLIMYALGEPLSMNALKKFMMNTWNFVSLPELYYNGDGYFMIKFHSREEKDAMLLRGPYTKYMKPMFLHEWTLEFQLKDDLLRR